MASLPLKSITIALAAAVAISSLPITGVQAGQRHNRHNNDLIAAGVIGLALGAIIVDSASRRQRRVDHIYHHMPAPIPHQPVVNYVEPDYEPYPDAEYYDQEPEFYEDRELYKHRTDQRPTVIRPPRIKKAYRHQPAPIKRDTGPKVITYDQAMTNVSQAEPWSAQWYSYCRRKFRSFDGKSGTYLGYDGKRHFCVSK